MGGGGGPCNVILALRARPQMVIYVQFTTLPSEAATIKIIALACPRCRRAFNAIIRVVD